MALRIAGIGWTVSVGILTGDGSLTETRDRCQEETVCFREAVGSVRVF